MIAERLAQFEPVETAYGPNGRPARLEMGNDGLVSRVTPLVGVNLNDGPITAPGLFDIQVNGFANVDFNVPGITPEKMDQALSGMLASGVTRCLPTLITASEEDLVALLAAMDAAVSASDLGPWMVQGYHIEGPFLSPEDGYSGCHPSQHMRPGSRDLVARLESVTTRPIKIMTVAPEVDGVLALIPFLIERGMVCSIGHSAASRAQIDAAIEAGATMSTHLGNGLPHLVNKYESSLLVQLGRDGLVAGFIADGLHIPKDVLQSWLRAKTINRALLVTDGTAASGAAGEGGVFTLGAEKVDRHPDGSVRIPGSEYLAGSAASMDQLVRNVMSWFEFSFGDALMVARENPLRAIGLAAGCADVGEAADFVEWELRDDVPYVRRAQIGPWVVHAENWQTSTRSA